MKECLENAIHRWQHASGCTSFALTWLKDRSINCTLLPLKPSADSDYTFIIKRSIYIFINKLSAHFIIFIIGLFSLFAWFRIMWFNVSILFCYTWLHCCGLNTWNTFLHAVQLLFALICRNSVSNFTSFVQCLAFKFSVFTCQPTVFLLTISRMDWFTNTWNIIKLTVSMFLTITLSSNSYFYVCKVYVQFISFRHKMQFQSGGLCIGKSDGAAMSKGSWGSSSIFFTQFQR